MAVAQQKPDITGERSATIAALLDGVWRIEAEKGVTPASLEEEQLPGRVQYDMAAGTCKVFPAQPYITCVPGVSA